VLSVNLAATAGTLPRTPSRPLLKYARSWLGAAIAATLLTTPSAFSLASSSNTHPLWRASAKLYASSLGTWEPTTSIDSLGKLRGILTVRGKGVTGPDVTATMTLTHLSWQGFTKVLTPPTITATMKRVSGSGASTTFVADLRIPTTLPVYWSVVEFVATDGSSRAQAGSGVMVGPPSQRTASNTLTVAKAHDFCSARPRLTDLRYAVYLSGYFAAIQYLDDGPLRGIVLDAARHVTPADVRSLVAHGHGIPWGGFPAPKSGWGTTPGFLDCSAGKPTGFSPTR
jgi:hypothetical protein